MTTTNLQAESHWNPSRTPELLPKFSTYRIFSPVCQMWHERVYVLVWCSTNRISAVSYVWPGGFIYNLRTDLANSFVRLCRDQKLGTASEDDTVKEFLKWGICDAVLASSCLETRAKYTPTSSARWHRKSWHRSTNNHQPPSVSWHCAFITELNVNKITWQPFRALRSKTIDFETPGACFKDAPV